ncbi:MAG: hypothetical protein U0792_07180 [Gemmataceae bacterium]
MVDLRLHVMVPFMETHAGEVLKYGVDLGYQRIAFSTRLAGATHTLREGHSAIR